MLFLCTGTTYKYTEAKVIQDGNIITSQGPATAFQFALKLTEALMGKEVKDKIAKDMLI